MNIQCTQKLLDKMKLAPALPAEQNAFFDWHARLLVINRHNTVLLMNDLSRYSLVLNGLKATDFKKMVGYFQQSLTEVLLAEDVDQETIDRYLQMAGPIRFTKTSNRSVAAHMTQIGLEVPFFFEDFEQSQIVQTDSFQRKSAFLFIYPNTDRSDIFMTSVTIGCT